jgi:hypothetical protein
MANPAAITEETEILGFMVSSSQQKKKEMVNDIIKYPNEL